MSSQIMFSMRLFSHLQGDMILGMTQSPLSVRMKTLVVLAAQVVLAILKILKGQKMRWWMVMHLIIQPSINISFIQSFTYLSLRIIQISCISPIASMYLMGFIFTLRLIFLYKLSQHNYVTFHIWSLLVFCLVFSLLTLFLDPIVAPYIWKVIDL